MDGAWPARSESRLGEAVRSRPTASLGRGVVGEAHLARAQGTSGRCVGCLSPPPRPTDVRVQMGPRLAARRSAPCRCCALRFAWPVLDAVVATFVAREAARCASSASAARWPSNTACSGATCCGSPSCARRRGGGADPPPPPTPGDDCGGPHRGGGCSRDLAEPSVSASTGAEAVWQGIVQLTDPRTRHVPPPPQDRGSGRLSPPERARRSRRRLAAGRDRPGRTAESSRCRGRTRARWGPRGQPSAPAAKWLGEVGHDPCGWLRQAERAHAGASTTCSSPGSSAARSRRRTLSGDVVDHRWHAAGPARALTRRAMP